MVMDTLLGAVLAAQNPSVLGLDTRIEYFPDEFASAYDLSTLEGAAEAVTDFNHILIDAMYDIIPAVKVQAAYYEMYGVPGMGAFYDTMDYAKRKGMVVIADVKRNDIGTTAGAYSAAYLGRTPLKGKEAQAFTADFITVNPYLGVDGIEPFTKDCQKYDKGIFVLVKTSNPSGGQLQNIDVGGCTLYERVGDFVAAWGQSLIGSMGYSSVGAVVGATYPKEGATLRKRMPSVCFLLPGYGAQGAKAADLTGCFDAKGLGAVVNASRSLQCAWMQAPGEKDFAKASRNAAIAMKQDICAALNAAGKGVWK
ncbi:MAG: orotidine-5'-phosphate decarboxylase [Bacillota bacterium]